MNARLFRTFLACLFGLGVSCVGSAQSSVWKVTRGGATLYLGGTCHVLRDSDFPLPVEFDTAYAASTQLVFETDIARVQGGEAQTLIVTEGMYVDGRTLETELKPATWKSVKAYCAQAGLPIETVRVMKPWLFTIVLAMSELQKLGITAEGVDLRFYKRARADQKKTAELETFDRHMKFLTTLGAGYENEMVAKSLEELGEVPAMLNDLLDAWRSGDLAKIDTLMLREMRDKYPAVFKSLLVDRNRAWLPRIEAMLTTQPVEFVLVGAGHLAGREGLVAMLRTRGYTVQQLNGGRAKR